MRADGFAESICQTGSEVTIPRGGVEMGQHPGAQTDQNDLTRSRSADTDVHEPPLSVCLCLCLSVTSRDSDGAPM